MHDQQTQFFLSVSFLLLRRFQFRPIPIYRGWQTECTERILVNSNRVYIRARRAYHTKCWIEPSELRSCNEQHCLSISSSCHEMYNDTHTAYVHTWIEWAQFQLQAPCLRFVYWHKKIYIGEDYLMWNVDALRSMFMLRACACTVYSSKGYTVQKGIKDTLCVARTSYGWNVVESAETKYKGNREGEKMER